jgi:hypothetical protein
MRMCKVSHIRARRKDVRKMDMERRYRQLQRATVARSALDVIALVFLFAGFAFWGVTFWQLLSPPSLLSLLSIQAAVLALAFALAAPLLLSMLVPTTPAGQLLQKTQWATIGFYVILASALFLVYQAEQMIEIWLYAQPGVVEGHFERRLAIVLVIAFVVVPALAWIQLTPERWVAAVQQAHQVRKLEMQQRGELAIIKASLIRAEMLAARGWANLLPLEQAEAITTLRGLLMGSADSMRSVVKTLGLDAELSRSIMGDDEIADQLDYVTQSIDVLPEITPIARVSTIAAVNPPAPGTSAPAAAHVDARPQSSEARDAESDTDVLSQAESDSVYHAIARALPPVFTAADVATRMQWTDKRSAQRVIRAWLAYGRAHEVRLGRYCLTEREAA